jgi:glycosyltransferase involved in cell wall biosynthesis
LWGTPGVDATRLERTVLDQRPVDIETLELSIVIPCLDEAETLEACIRKALAAIDEHRLRAEILVADNGSTDGSQAIAERLGARVVPIASRGYGSALRGGIEAARGEFVVMADGDDSYDFGEVNRYVDKLREGYDLVMGNRFKGGIEAGAMPWKHRWIGNPVLSGVGRLFFRVPVRDFHCGMRGFRRDAYARMDLHTTGMEFASEMVIKATLNRMRIAEIPTVLHRDGRSRPPHLRSFRDGWRHLRFMLLYSPRWLFLVPGLGLLVVGLLGSAWLVTGTRQVGSLYLDVNTLLVTSFTAMIGYQLVIFAVFTKIFAVREGFHPQSHNLNRMFRFFRLETGLVVGVVMALGGFLLLLSVLFNWRGQGFGQLDPRSTMRATIPAVVLLFMGVQTVFASFFLSILGIRDDHNRVPGLSI